MAYQVVFHLLEQLGTWELRRELLELPQEVFHLETMLSLELQWQMRLL